jgi:VCBS repeat-containing protein
MGADGRFTYTVDNNLPEVQALRMLLDGLVDTFTYTVSDDHGATDQATLRVLILGQNDNPVAHDDAGNAIEAGGRYNATPGADATGNVLDNDTDVDQYGETKAVTAINGPLGAGAVAGTTAGRYGTLTVQADGSYRYVIDNDNAAVQALRTSDETLTETFVYVVADRAGATATATLTITIHGQNDAPVARDDSNNVDNIHGQPITSGNVLPNDSDVDTGDQLTVVGIRPGAKDAGGASTPPGTRIAGSYGYLQINADGSYTYDRPDQSAPCRPRPGGSILVDVFTYTVADRAGATDSGNWSSRSISTPYVPPPSPGDHEYFLHDEWHRDRFGTTLGVDPVVYVTPEVRSIFPSSSAQRQPAARREPGHGDAAAYPVALAGGGSRDDVRRVPAPALLQLEAIVQFEAERTAGRHGTSLSADRLLRDPSVRAQGHRGPPEKAAPSDGKHDKRGKSAKRTRAAMLATTEPARPAASFTDQIRQLASRPSTVAALSHANNSTNEDAKK